MTTIYTLTEPQGTQVAGQTVGAIISTAGGFGPTSNTDTKVVISDTFPLINGKGGETVFARKGGYYLRSAIYKNKFYEGLNGSVYPDPTKDEPYQQFFKNARESCLEPDRELWLGFSIYVPSSFENENSSTANLSTQRTRMFVLQPSDVDRSIALLSITKDSLSNTADNIWLLSYYDNATSVYEGSAKNVSLGYVKDDVGKWVDFVVRVRWNPFTTTTNPATAGIAKAVNQTFEGNKGILEIWKSTGEVNTTTGNRQMTKVFSIVNQPVGNVPGYEETTGSTTIDVARFSWGPYKYSWKKVAGSTVTGPIWFGFDEIKYGYADQGITYDTVLARSETYQPPVFPPPVSSATYVIPAGNFGSNTRVFDGTNLSAGFGGTSWRTTTGVTRLPQAGDIIELAEGQHIQYQLRFRNINGSSSNRIIVRGPQTGTQQAVIRRLTPVTGDFVWYLIDCNHMTIDGYLPAAGTSSSPPYNCGIKVTYAVNAVAGLGTTNKDGPSYWVFWGGPNSAAITGATFQYCEIDGGWIYASPEVDPGEGEGSGYSFEGIGIKIGSTAAANGTWNENIKLLRNWVRRCQGEGFYIGNNMPNGAIPHRNVEQAYNRIEDGGGGAIHQKQLLEGNNSVHHNLLLRCGQNAPTPSRIAITMRGSTSRVYNNWIEETAANSTRIALAETATHAIEAYMVSSSNIPEKGGKWLDLYGPYSTLPVYFYNNVIIRGANATLMAATNNQSDGIRVGAADPTKLAFSAYIYNNTILDNYGNGIAVNYADAGFIRNNIVLGNKLNQITIRSGTPVTASGNVTSGSPSSLFVNYSADDFKLAAAVPASGTIGVDISATDYVDTVRETGSPDAGAYEFIETTPPPVTTATYIIPANGASNTRREYDAAQASTGFNGSAWITTSSIARAPQPGDVIEFAAGTHGRTRFSNFQGTSANKYLFKGPNTGLAIFRKATSYVSNFLLDFTTCKHFIVDGESTTQPAAVDGKRRNIKLMYPVTWDTKDGTSYLKFNGNDGSSTVTTSNNCTVRYVEVDGGWSDDNNFFESTGLGIQTNDNGSLATDHPGLYQENIIIEHCYIRNIPGEGMYIGPNYEIDVNLRKTPLRNITIRYNRVENTGVEGIGGKCWFGGVNAIHDNYCINNCVSSYNNNGRNAIAAQACSTDIYNNFIFKSGQSGIGLGNNFGITPTSLQPGGYYVTEFNNDVYNNVIVKTGLNTTFFTNGSGIGGNSSAGESRHVVHAFNNTIANVTKDGIQVDTGFIRNNIVVFYRLLATDFVIATNPGDATNNYTVNTPGTYFVNQDLDNPENGDWRLISPRAAVGTVGIDISATDITGTQRDSNPELGAYESGGAPPGGSVITTGLISYLDASNSSSYPLTGITWIDLSSSRVNFTIYNGGIFNSNSFVLDGVNDYIATGTSVLNLNANTGNNRTVEIWFKLLSWPVNGSQSFPTKGMLLGGAYNSTGALSIEGSGTNQGKFAWDWDDSTTIYGNTTLQLNTWYQLVLLFRSPRYVTYYVNGALDKAEFQTNDTTVNDQLEWNIGRSSRSFPTVNAVSDSSGNVVTPAEGPFYNLNVNCEVAIARQYSRLLSTSEILQNYNADKGKFDITFPVPTAPTLTAQVDSVAPTTKINLTWTASTVTSGTIANYELYKQSGTTWTNIYTGANRSFSDVNLTADTTYNYRVRAVSSSNQFSAYSTASAKTAAQPPAPAFSTFIIPSGTSDWDASIAQPNTLGTSKIPAGGDVIIISAGTSTTSASSGTRGPLIIRNVNGTSTKTIEIKCPTDGNIDIRKPAVSVGGVPLTIANSRHFILNGFSQNITAQNAQNNCGIRLLYATNAKVGTPDSPEAFLKITNSTTAGPSENYTIKYIFIDGGYVTGFANDGYGILASDPSATRTNFPGKFIENISFENIVIISTTQQGMRIGSTLSSSGLPIRNCAISNVRAENTRIDAIQLRGALEGINQIYNCELLGCGKDASTLLTGGERTALTVQESEVSIYNNVIKDSGDHGIRILSWVGPGPGVSIGTGYPGYNRFIAEIYNNLLIRNGFFNSSNKSGIRATTTTGMIPILVKIYNNTCVSNIGHGINININCTGGFVRNNICVENNSNAAQILISSSTVAEANNLITGTATSLFVNPLVDNYRLVNPQLAQGAFETDISLTDIEGTAREITAPDVGAYEYTGVSNSADYTILAGTSNTFSVRNESSGDIIFTGTSWIASVVQPGQIIEFAPGVHGKRYIQRLQGSAQNRITIRSSSQGKATIRSAVTDSDGQIFHIRDSNYYNIDGSNTPGETYGIKIMYSSAATPGGPLWFLRMDNEQYGQDVLGYPCRDVTVNNVEIDGGYGTAGVTNGAGISWNIVDGYFLRTVFGETTVFPSNLIIENCYVHHTETEGMYLGANHGKGLVGRENIIVRNCIIENVGWEAINIKAHWQGNNRVYNNRIIDAGLNPINGRSEASGINFTSSSGSAYNNYINGTAENGILFFNVSGGPLQSAYPNGTECYIYNNVVYGAGKHNTHDPNIFDSNQPNPKGINVGSERGDTARMKPFIFNNTIVDAASAGINLQVSDSYTGGFVKNNIIARSNPPAPWNHFVADGLKTPYVALEDADTSNIVAVANNPTSASFADAARYDFRLTAPIAATGTIGVDISATDITGTARETSSPDAGAYEYVGISTIYNPPFPRLGGRMRLDDNVSDAQFYEDTAIIAKFHVWLESTFRTHSWVGGTYNLSNYIPFVKSLDTPYPGYTVIAGPYTNPVQTGTDVRQFVEKAFAEKGVGGNRDWMLRYAGTPVYSAWNDPVTYTTSGRNVIEAGKSVGGSTDSNVSNKFRGNPNLATTPDSSRVQPFPNGMRWHQWYARWFAAPASERTANGGSPLGDWTASGYGFMEPGSGWDFVYSDEVTLGDSFSNPNNADWDDDGVNEARTDAEIRTMIKNYHVDYCQTWKTLFQYYGRPNMMFFANLASLSAASQEWYKNTELVDLYNGGICERVSGYEHGGSYAPYGAPVTGQGFGFGDWSAAVSTGDTGTGFMGRYWRAMRYTKNPKLVMFETDTTQVKAQWDAAGGIHAGKSLYYWARYYLCACLLDDGYYYASNGGSDKASGTPEAAFGRIPWLDEYQGGSLNQKGWMGYPKLPTPPRTAYSNGVWVREFDNALVVINPYQNGTRTITLPSPGSGFKWQRLSGTQDPTTNNGADQPLSLTIAEHDGFILRRVAVLSYTATWETGQKQINGSTTDGGFVQAMEDSTYVDKTDYTSVGAAGFGPSTNYDIRIVASKLWGGTTVTPRNGNYFLSQTIYYDKHYSDFKAVNGDARTEFDSLDKPRTVMSYSTNQAAYKMPLNEEVWYGFSIYLPADLEHDTWNGSTPLNGSNNNTNILASSRLQADANRTLWSIQYRVCSDINASISRWTISRYISTGTVEANKSETDLGSVSGDLGKWTDFIIRYKNNPYTTQTTVGSRTYQPNSGILEVWKSYGDYIGATKDRYMTKVLSIVNAPVGLGETTGTDGMDFRKEQYKYNWKRWAPSGTDVVSPSTVTGPIFIGYDELRVGTAANGIGFAQVHPTGKTEAAVANSDATFVIPTSNISSTRTFDASNASTGFAGGPWVTSTGTARVPQAGDIIELAAGRHGLLTFESVVGAVNNRITIRGPSAGLATIRATNVGTAVMVLQLSRCRHLNLDGTSTDSGARLGPDGLRRSILVTYALNATPLNKDNVNSFIRFRGNANDQTYSNTQDVTIRRVEIDGGYYTNDQASSYTNDGIGIATNDQSLLLENYPGAWQENLEFVYNYVHHVEGEGLYVGSNYATPVKVPVRNAVVAYNYLTDTGFEGAQVKSAFGGTVLHHNVVLRCGGNPSNPKAGLTVQNSNGTLYNNWVEYSGAEGISGWSGMYPVTSEYPTLNYIVYNNVVIRAGYVGTADAGIKCVADAGSATITAQIYNNTILYATEYGIRFGTNTHPSSFVHNNIALENGVANISGAFNQSGNLDSGLISTYLVGPVTSYGTTNVSLVSAYPATGPTVPPTDYFDQTRSSPDVGAVEYL